ncbi:MAG: peptidoglycan bridge formation glycyltransferase FemA/FemB family protein [Patescibacteria group bacterium]
MRSFLQTQGWLDFQKSIGRKTWRFDNGKIRANIIRHDIPFGKNYLYIPHGPEISLGEIQSGLKNEVDNFLKYLKDLGKENKSIFVKMEPVDDVVTEVIYRKGLKHSKKSIQPTKTVIVDLNLPEETLLSKMHHKTRYNIRLAEKRGLKLEEREDIKTFWKLLKKTAKNDNFSTHNCEYYEKLIKFFSNDKEFKTKMVFEMSEGRGLAGAILLAFGDTVYYLHGAMDREYKSWMAPYLMHWEIIKWAKAQGYRYYDFWGIDAKRWPGVTRFKLGFGGQQVEYPGSFDMPVSKIWYLIYKIVRKIF